LDKEINWECEEVEGLEVIVDKVKVDDFGK